MAVKGKKQKKYRPLTREEREDFVTQEATIGEDQESPLWTFKARSWEKPAALKHKSAERKRKDQQAKTEKEERLWRESGLSWPDWVAKRKDERKRRQGQVVDLTEEQAASTTETWETDWPASSSSGREWTPGPGLAHAINFAWAAWECAAWEAKRQQPKSSSWTRRRLE